LGNYHPQGNRLLKNSPKYNNRLQLPKRLNRCPLQVQYTLASSQGRLLMCCINYKPDVAGGYLDQGAEGINKVVEAAAQVKGAASDYRDNILHNMVKTKDSVQQLIALSLRRRRHLPPMLQDSNGDNLLSNNKVNYRGLRVVD
jgi:hypothetical protein